MNNLINALIAKHGNNLIAIVQEIDMVRRLAESQNRSLRSKETWIRRKAKAT